MTETGPAGQHTVRRHNCALVLDAVAQSPGISRAEIAARTGLTKATVSSLVDRLLSASLVHDSGPQRRAGPGRRGTSLSLSPTGPHGLGVEIAVDYVATCLVDLTGTVHDLRVRHGDNRHRPVGRVLGKVKRAIATAREQARRRAVPVGGIGVAVPGLVEATTGLLRVAPNLDWHELDLPARLRSGTGMPAADVLVGNEANLAALAESWARGERGPKDFVHVSGEIGIGAGIVLGGEPYEGAHGFGGELGHFPVDRQGPRCTCGARGCLERLAGQEAVLSRANASDLEDLVGRLRIGDPVATEAVERAAGALGSALSAVVNLLDIPVVVLGGSYARLHPWLADPLLAELRTRVVGAPWSRIEVLASSLGTEAAVRGAAASVVRTILADPDSYLSRC